MEKYSAESYMITTEESKRRYDVMHLMNSLMMPAPGLIYSPIKLTKWEFKDVWKHHIQNSVRWTSSIGYPQLADLLSDLLKAKIPVSREKTECKDGDLLLVAKLPYRIFNPSEKGDRKHGSEISDYEFFSVNVDSIHASWKK